jgi:hypothetical protein
MDSYGSCEGEEDHEDDLEECHDFRYRWSFEVSRMVLGSFWWEFGGDEVGLGKAAALIKRWEQMTSKQSRC